MASNPTLTADPAAGASDAIDLGGSGASETMDSILDTALDGGADSPVVDQDVPEVVMPDEDAAAAVKDGAELDLRTTPNWLKNALRSETDPKVQAQIRQAWNKLQGFGANFKTVAEAKQLAETVQQAGGPQKVKELIATDQDYQKRDSAFFSGDPTQQEPLIVEWLQHDPNACYSAFQVTSDLLKRNFPEEFTAYSTGIARDTLDGFSEGKFSPFMDTFAQIAEGGTPEQLKQSAQRLAEWWQSAREKIGYGNKALDPTRPDPREQRLAQQAKDLEAKQNGFFNTQFKTFQDSFKSSMESQMSGLSKAIVDKSYASSKLTEGAKQRIADDLSNEIRRSVVSNPEVQRQIQALIDPSGKRNASAYQMTDAVRQKVVDLLVSRAKQAAPGKAKEVFGNWTKILVGERKQAIATRQNNSRRPDVSGGAPASYGRSGTLTPAEASKMSFDDLLNDERPVARR